MELISTANVHSQIKPGSYTERLTRLSEMGQLLNQTTVEAEIFWLAAHYTVGIVPADRVGVVLITPDNQHFTLITVLGDPGSVEISQPMSLAGTAIARAIDSQRLFHVPDLLNSEFKNVSRLGQAGFRSFMVAPMVVAGRPIGAINVASRTVDVYTQRDKELLTHIASFLGITVENARRTRELMASNQQLQAANQRLEADLTLAHRIQNELLPPPRLHLKTLELACYSQPARHVGGDFYSYYHRSDQHLALAVGDVSGHDMAAALMMSVSLALLNSLLPLELPVTDLLHQLDQRLIPYTQSTGQNCALTCAILSDVNGSWQLNWANAGGLAPYIRHADGRLITPRLYGLPLGVGIPGTVRAAQTVQRLCPGDMLVLTTDGVAEAQTTALALFGFERLEQTIAAGPGHDAQAMINHIHASVSAFTNHAMLSDDLTIAVVRV